MSMKLLVLTQLILSALTFSCQSRNSQTKDIVTDLPEGNGKTYHYSYVKDEFGERLLRGECVGGLTESFCKQNLQAREYPEVKTKLTSLATLPRAGQVEEAIKSTNLLIADNDKNLTKAKADLTALDSSIATKNQELQALGNIDLGQERSRLKDLEAQETKLKERLAANPNDANVKALLATVTKEISDTKTKINTYEGLKSQIAALEATKVTQSKLVVDLTSQQSELTQRLSTLEKEKTELSNTLNARLNNLFKLLEDQGVGYRILTANELFPEHRADMAFLNTAFEQSVRSLVSGAAFNTGGEVYSSPAIMSDGTVVVGSLDGHVYWLKDDKEVFKFKTGESVFSSPAIMSDGTVVVGSPDGHVYWLKDGKEVFKFKTGGRVVSNPTIMGDGTVVVGSGDGDGHVYWLKDGKEVFKFKTGSFVSSGSTIMGDGTVVVGSTDYHVYWLKDGERVFMFQTGGGVRSSPAIMSDGTVVVGSDDGNVYWLKDGKKVFKFKTGGGVRSSPAIMSDGTIVVGSNDRHVYWLKDGKEVFKFKTGGGVESSPAIMSDGTVVVGSHDTRVYWLKDGNEVFKFKTGKAVESSPAIMSDGTIVVGSSNGLVYWLKY